MWRHLFVLRHGTTRELQVLGVSVATSEARLGDKLARTAPFPEMDIGDNTRADPQSWAAAFLFAAVLKFEPKLPLFRREHIA